LQEPSQFLRDYEHSLAPAKPAWRIGLAKRLGNADKSALQGTLVSAGSADDLLNTECRFGALRVSLDSGV
jgi:hypothetical protein